MWKWLATNRLNLLCSILTNLHFQVNTTITHKKKKTKKTKKKKQLHKHTLDKINLSLAGSRGSATVKKDWFIIMTLVTRKWSISTSSYKKTVQFIHNNILWLIFFFEINCFNSFNSQDLVVNSPPSLLNIF